jgi:hypothetical protein
LGREHAIEHLAYSSVDDCVQTLARYARREAQQAFEQGMGPSVVRMVWRPIKRLAGNYVLRRGFLDGVPGLIVSLAVSWYLFLVEAHLWEMHRQAKGK